MCQYISFFFDDNAAILPDVLVAALYSHGATEQLLSLNPAGPYTEGHYLPDGKVECRIVGGRSGKSESAIKTKWPTFLEFEAWAKIARAVYYDVNGYDVYDYNAEGYDVYGYNDEGWNAQGYNDEGYDVNGYDIGGYDVDGFDDQGWNAEGFDVDGHNRRLQQ